MTEKTKAFHCSSCLSYIGQVGRAVCTATFAISGLPQEGVAGAIFVYERPGIEPICNRSLAAITKPETGSLRVTLLPFYGRGWVMFLDLFSQNPLNKSLHVELEVVRVLPCLIQVCGPQSMSLRKIVMRRVYLTNPRSFGETSMHALGMMACYGRMWLAEMVMLT